MALGDLAQLRGDYDAALDWYRKSLAIKEQIGDRAGMAASYHQLGIIAQDRDYDGRSTGTASRWRSENSSATALVWPRATISLA